MRYDATAVAFARARRRAAFKREHVLVDLKGGDLGCLDTLPRLRLLGAGALQLRLDSLQGEVLGSWVGS